MIVNGRQVNIFCVIPAYNEEQAIRGVVEKVKHRVDKVVVVDDGSHDGTRANALSGGAIVLSHLINRGQGAALSTGTMYALQHGADIVVHFDADDQFVAEEISDVIKPILDNEAQVVFGSRFLGKRSNMPWLKEKLFMPLGRLVNRLLAGVDLTDPQSGFRAMDKAAMSSISIDQDGMAHCSEIIFKAFSKKLRVKEVPITVIYHEFGQKFGGGVKIIRDLLISKLIS